MSRLAVLLLLAGCGPADTLEGVWVEPVDTMSLCVNGRCDSQCRTARDCQLYDPTAQCVPIGDGLQACSFRDGGVRDVPASFNDVSTQDAATGTDATSLDGGG